MAVWPLPARRSPACSAAPAACVVPERAAPSRGAVVVIVVLLAAATLLFLVGYPVGAVLGVLAGACGIAVETLRQLSPSLTPIAITAAPTYPPTV